MNSTQLTSNLKSIGTITAVRGQVVEIAGTEEAPRIHEMLTISGNAEVRLEVVSSSQNSGIAREGYLGGWRFYCLVLSGIEFIARGMEVCSTGKMVSVQVGKEILGRVHDIFGQTHDGKGPLNSTEEREIGETDSPDLTKVRPIRDVLETGIKAIDFFAPMLKGGKVGLFGGAGVGKTILLTELINNLVIRNPNNRESLVVYAAVGERSREAQELYATLERTEVFRYMTLLLGQMGENAAVRWRTAFAAARIAQYFRDEERKNVLFLMDNMYRFAQAGHELSIMMSAIPSEDGYQPTLTSEMGQIHEQLRSLEAAFVTTIEAVFVPSDDMTDYAVRSTFPFVETFVILSREVYQQGILPAMDLLASNSTALSRQYLDPVHYETYLQAKALLEQAARLEKMVSLVGFSELSPEDQVVYKRAQLLQNYMTQNFFTTAEQTGKIGTYVPLRQTVSDVREILKGRFDVIHPDKLLFVGSIEEILG